jgi:hypothetical protein
MAIQNLSNQAISASYQNLMQVSSSGQLYNGTGSLIISVVANSFTGSLFGTSSRAVNASTASFVTPLNQNVVITGSLNNGSINTATGDYSHAEGYGSNAYGFASHAEGSGNTANANTSHAEGVGTSTNGESSHAEGSQTITYGLASHAEGVGTITSASYQHAQGAYNITSSIASAFILGNGTSNVNRSNLILAYGTQVQITGSLRVSGSITGSLQGTSTLIPIASSSISAGSIFFDTATNKLYVHNGTSWKTASLG